MTILVHGSHSSKKPVMIEAMLFRSQTVYRSVSTALFRSTPYLCYPFSDTLSVEPLLSCIQR